MSYFSRNMKAVNPFTEALDDRVQKGGSILSLNSLPKRELTVKAEAMTRAAEQATKDANDPKFKHAAREVAVKARDAQLAAVDAHSKAMLDCSQSGDEGMAQMHMSQMRGHMRTAQSYNTMATSAGDGYYDY